MVRSQAGEPHDGSGPRMRRLALAHLCQEGAAAFLAGRPARAEAYLQAALALRDDDADLWALRGAAAADSGTRAVCVRRALSLCPDHRPARSLLAEMPTAARESILRGLARGQPPHGSVGDNGAARWESAAALARAWAGARPRRVSLPAWAAASTWRLLAGLVLALVLALNLLVGNLYARKYRQAIYPGVRIARLDVGGLAPVQAQEHIQRQLTPLLSQAFRLEAGPPGWSFSASELGLRCRLAQAIAEAWALGRGGNAVADWFEQFRLALFGREVPLAAAIDQEQVRRTVEAVAAEVDRPAVPPAVSWQEGTWAVAAGHDGRHVLRAELERRLAAALTDLVEGRTPPGPVPWTIAVPVVTDTAALSAAQVADLQRQLEWAGRPLTLCGADRSWSLQPADIAPWLRVELSPPAVGIEHRSLLAYFEALAPDLALDALPPRLEVVGDRAVAFQFGREGRRLDVAAAVSQTAALLRRRLAGEEVDVLDLPLVVLPAGDDALMAQLGIVELVGEGTSTFAGSSWERATNIRIGGQELHGRLIAPDEVFSLNDALGPITWEKGYQYSLIIGSGGVMYYGLGGGLCQVATSLYRAALYSGLEIVERTPHLWRIEYYEQDAPPGFDATIYAGGPDLKFRNNTGHYLLLQVETDLSASRQTIRFYGTSPGWSVSIEDYWLSADGHSASYRRVIRRDGQVLDEQTFYSYYW